MRVSVIMQLGNKLENKLGERLMEKISERNASESLHAMRAYQNAHRLA